MKRKAVFLDRDGTINLDKGYVYKISDFEYLPGVKEGLKLLQKAGFLLIVITNQSGIGRGYYDEDDFEILNGWMLWDLENEGIYIDKTYYCPHHPQATILKYRKKCNCRKPEIGLYQKAIEDYEIDIGQSYVIGDRIRDLSICELDSSIKGYLLYRGKYKAHGNVTMIQGGLLEAAQCITCV